MEDRPREIANDETAPIVVHYWASARAAAGTGSDELPVTDSLTLSDVVRRAGELHPGTRLPDVLAVCSVLLGDRPVSSADASTVLVRPGETVEFLPPFAGG